MEIGAGIEIKLKKKKVKLYEPTVCHTNFFLNIYFNSFNCYNNQ